MTDSVYRERAHLLAHLAAIYDAHMQPDPEHPNWPVLYIDFPTGGQCCWHISDADLDLFGHVRTDITEVWDEHTTDEKYRRVDRATRARVVGKESWAV